MTHDDLWKACKKLPEDYSPYGNEKERNMDCSFGCRFFHKLGGATGADWGVCGNLESHRSGLLTFEHQGCNKCLPWRHSKGLHRHLGDDSQ